MLRIKQLRREKGLKQEELAKEFGIAQQTISNYEKGIREPDITTLKNMADFFDVSLDYLLGKTDIRTPIEALALSRSDGYENGLPEEAMKEIELFKEFIRHKYLNNTEQ
ncbi:MAG: helix-turn-helix domain-containing protein [Candidatus Alkaliphilus sp. MAG34]|jgi:transcriptional regulator with XRE-family HTH domain|nr:helix-turn-helix transcriptional regulator [Clostridiales bacterium]